MCKEDARDKVMLCYKAAGIAAVLSLVAFSAQAGSLYEVEGSMKDAYVAPFSFTGFYLGATVGAGSFDGEVSEYDEDATAFGSVQLDSISATGGLQIGFNQQIDNIVVGIEGDFNWTGFDKTREYDNGDYLYSSTWDNFSTIRARLGLAVDRAMVYVTGGVAFVNQESIVSDDITDPDETVESDDLKTAFVGGAGVEVILANNITFKGEYLYVAPEDDYVANADDVDASFDTDAHIARVGINYIFDWGR